jgi:hypothetical protein
MLPVDITKRRLSESINQFSDWPSLNVQVIHLNEIFHSSLGTGRVAEEHIRASERFCLVQMQHLPDPIHSIHHRVLQEEGRIDR